MADDNGMDTGSETSAEQAQPEKTIDRETYTRVVRAKEGLESQVSQLREQLANYESRVSQVDDLQQQLMSVQGEFSTWKTVTETLGRADGEAIEAITWQFSKVEDPEKDLATWLTGLKQDPSTAPTVLRPFLQVSEPAATEPALELSSGPGPKKPAPRAQAPSAQPPAAPSTYSPEEIRKIRLEAVRTNDWSKYRQVRKALGIAE